MILILVKDTDLEDSGLHVHFLFLDKYGELMPDFLYEQYSKGSTFQYFLERRLVSPLCPSNDCILRMQQPFMG